jgi:predicted DNA-binding transcriptional regulator AlpA
MPSFSGWIALFLKRLGLVARATLGASAHVIPQDEPGLRFEFGTNFKKEQEEMNSQYQPLDRLLTIKQVMDITGFKRTYIYDRISKNKFPKQRKPGGGTHSRWSEREIQAWVDASAGMQ